MVWSSGRGQRTVNLECLPIIEIYKDHKLQKRCIALTVTDVSVSIQQDAARSAAHCQEMKRQEEFVDTLCHEIRYVCHISCLQTGYAHQISYLILLRELSNPLNGACITAGLLKDGVDKLGQWSASAAPFDKTAVGQLVAELQDLASTLMVCCDQQRVLVDGMCLNESIVV